jgi:hypothetical protein
VFNGQVTTDMIETLVTVVSKLSDEVAQLKIDKLELLRTTKRKQIIDLKGTPCALHIWKKIRSKFLSGHCLLCPTVKLQQAGRSVSNLRLPTRRVNKCHPRKSCQPASNTEQSLLRMVLQP